MSTQPRLKDGLPREAFAIQGDPDDPSTWKLPHHTRTMTRMMKRKMTDRERELTVDWDLVAAAVAALSPGGFRGRRVEAEPEQVLAAARHLAAHCRHAAKPVPNTIQAIL